MGIFSGCLSQGVESLLEIANESDVSGGVGVVSAPVDRVGGRDLEPELPEIFLNVLQCRNALMRAVAEYDLNSRATESLSKLLHERR